MTDYNGIEQIYKFHDVLFLPSYVVNLMSVSRAEVMGKTFIFKGDQLVIQCGQDEALPMCLQGHLYYIRCRSSGLPQAHSAKRSRDATLSHRRKGQLIFKDVRKGDSDLNGAQCELCEVCGMSKFHELPVTVQTQFQEQTESDRSRTV